jgi:hypothetical protein
MSSKRLRFVLVMGLLVSVPPSRAAAQDPPSVAPGSVATLPVRLPVPLAAGESARLRVVLAEGLQLFGQAERTVTVPSAGELIVPLTFQLPTTFPAGVARVASVEVQWSDGTWSRMGLEIRVSVVARLSLGLGESAGTVTPGNSVEVPFSIVNEGNATDSIFLGLDQAPDWEIEGPPQPFVLDPNATASGVIRLEAPRTAATGSMKRVALVATGTRSQATERISVYVIQDESWGATYERLPTSVFVGAFTAPDTLASLDQVIASVNAYGVVGGDTEIGIRASRYADRVPPSSFRSLLPPPRFQLMLGRPTWRATVGDTYFTPEPFGTFIRNAQGINVQLDRGALNGSLLVGRPLSGADRNEGHVVLGDLSVARVGQGRLSVLVTEAAQTLFTGGMPERSQALGARYRLSSLRGALFEAEAGWTRVTDSANRSESGPTGAIRGRVGGPDQSLDFAARYVPASLPGITAGASEAFLAGAKRLTGATRAVGQARYFHRPLLGSDFSPRTVSGTLGFGLTPLAFTDFLATYQFRRAFETGVLGLDETEHRIGLDANVDLGRVSFRLGARRGTATLAGEESPTLRFTGSLRYADRYAMLGLATWYESGGFRPTRIQSQLDAQWTYRALSMAAGLIVSRTEGLGYDDPYGWANVAVQLRHDLALVLGVEENTTTISQGEVRFSLGLRKDFGLPLPVRRKPVVEGEVYQDADNNGRRDPGEPGVPDVRLILGPKEVSTDHEGRFRVDGEAFRGYPLQVDVTSLAEDVLLPPSRRLPSEGQVSIPVLETTTGVLTFFLDSNRSGRRDADEGAAAGARITLTDPVGRVLVHFTDDRGVVHLSGLPYGAYSVSAVVPEGTRNRETETTFTLEVTRGETLAREVGLDDGARTILFRSEPDADSLPRVPAVPTFDFGSPTDRVVAPRDGGRDGDAAPRQQGDPPPRQKQEEGAAPGQVPVDDRPHEDPAGGTGAPTQPKKQDSEAHDAHAEPAPRQDGRAKGGPSLALRAIPPEPAVLRTGAFRPPVGLAVAVTPHRIDVAPPAALALRELEPKAATLMARHDRQALALQVPADPVATDVGPAAALALRELEPKVVPPTGAALAPVVALRTLAVPAVPLPPAFGLALAGSHLAWAEAPPVPVRPAVSGTRATEAGVRPVQIEASDTTGGARLRRPVVASLLPPTATAASVPWSLRARPVEENRDTGPPGPREYPALPRWLEVRLHAGRRGRRRDPGRSLAEVPS